jgi:hypothetical protein
LSSRLAKTALDSFITALHLATVSVSLLVVALIVRLGGGPALYPQKSIGAGERLFDSIDTVFVALLVVAGLILPALLVRNMPRTYARVQ